MEQNPKIKIHIVEDQEIFRAGLKAVLSEIPDVKVIGESSDGQEFLEQVSKQLPDIVFMDIKMPRMDGVKATEEALARYPGLKIIILSLFGEEEHVSNMLRLGIHGFILKNTDKATIQKAIEQVYSGNHYFSGEIMSVLARTFYKNSKDRNLIDAISLSRRELEVLELLCRGFTNKEMAEKLFLSPRTVEGYKSKLMQKTGQSNSLNLILWAAKNNIVTLDN
jgi:DNA-binding NarL/FixJ family response regulator